MPISKILEPTLEQQIAQIYGTINEVIYPTPPMNRILESRKVVLDLIREYNKIADMTNQVFEKRISEIENTVKQINNKI